MVGVIIIALVGLIWIIDVLYRVLIYEKSVGEIKGIANSGMGNTPHITIEFTDNNGEEHIYTALNTSWGKKGAKRKVYYKADDPTKVYAISWYDFAWPIGMLILAGVLLWVYF